MTRTPLLLAALALTGCTSSVTGNLGNFTFSYFADDDFLDFNKPVAVGAKVDLFVNEVGTNEPVTLTSAAFDDPAVLDVVSFGTNKVVVTGTGDGSALLQVEADTPSGENLPDEVNMLAATPEVMKLEHTCAPGVDKALYLIDQQIWVPYEFERANGQSIIGYGYYPAEIEGTSIVFDEDASGMQWLRFDTAEVGITSLSSPFDATRIEVEVIEEAQIDGAVKPIEFVWEDIDAGDTNAFYVLPAVGEDPICQANVSKTVVSDTPETCTITDSQGDDAANEFGWFEVTGVAAGECLFTVTYPSGNGGEGASAQFSTMIEP